MKKFQVFIVAILMVTVFSSTYFVINFMNSKGDIGDVEYHFSESKYSEDELITNSDIIVKGKFTEFKEKKTASMEQVMENGKKFNVNFPYSVYMLDISEFLKGENNTKKVEVVFVGVKPEDINIGEEYIIFLEKNNIDKDKYYSMVSYTQAFYKMEYSVETQTETWKNQKTNMEFNKIDLVNKINNIK